MQEAVNRHIHPAGEVIDVDQIAVGGVGVLGEDVAGEVHDGDDVVVGVLEVEVRLGIGPGVVIIGDLGDQLINILRPPDIIPSGPAASPNSQRNRYGVPRLQALPQVPSPTLAEVHTPRVASVCFSDAPSEAILRIGHGDQMDVVGHQAVGPDFDAASPAPLGHKSEIRPVVVLAEEGLLSAISPLRHVMGVARHNDTCDSRHCCSLHAHTTQAKK